MVLLNLAANIGQYFQIPPILSPFFLLQAFIFFVSLFLGKFSSIAVHIMSKNIKAVTHELNTGQYAGVGRDTHTIHSSPGVMK